MAVKCTSRHSWSPESRIDTPAYAFCFISQESSSILPPWLEDVFSATTNLLPGSKDSSTRAVAPELLGAKVQINHCAQVKNPHSEFARQVLRQVATLPGGMPMGKLLTAADAIMRTAEATCDSAQQAAVVHSYVKLSINDIIQDAWQKRRQQLATDPVQVRAAAVGV